MRLKHARLKVSAISVLKLLRTLLNDIPEDLATTYANVNDQNDPQCCALQLTNLSDLRSKNNLGITIAETASLCVSFVTS